MSQTCQISLFISAREQLIPLPRGASFRTKNCVQALKLWWRCNYYGITRLLQYGGILLSSPYSSSISSCAVPGLRQWPHVLLFHHTMDFEVACWSQGMPQAQIRGALVGGTSWAGQTCEPPSLTVCSDGKSRLRHGDYVWLARLHCIWTEFDCSIAIIKVP